MALALLPVLASSFVAPPARLAVASARPASTVAPKMVAAYAPPFTPDGVSSTTPWMSAYNYEGYGGTTGMRKNGMNGMNGMYSGSPRYQAYTYGTYYPGQVYGADERMMLLRSGV